METIIEQRKESRTDIAWPVSMWLPSANRFFNARSSNISRTGVLLTAPVTAPVKPGQVVELNFPRSEHTAREKGSFARIKQGKVVRVERRHTLSTANIGIAVVFEN